MSVTPAPAAPDLDSAEKLLAYFEQLEQQLQQVRSGLTHSHRLMTLGTLTSVVAHEYNNILTPIISYAQWALSKPDDQALMRKAVEKALAGAERAAAVSASLLGFARQEEQQRSASLPGAIDDALACLARDPRKDGIELAIDVPDVQVAIAPLNLQQVLINLVLNAKKAMRRTGGSLRITARAGGGEVHLSVADTGPGIPESIRDRLFEPFVTQQAPAGDTAGPGEAEPRGTGLGLCICRDLVRAAGGDIAVESAAGRGATFHIRLPRAQDCFEST